MEIKPQPLSPRLSRKVPTRLQDNISKYAVTIRRPPEEVFDFFRNFENLPRFMKDIRQVKVLSPTRSRWEVEIKGGFKTDWEADITSERKGEMITWRSIPGSEVETTGSVWFYPAPKDLGTEVSLLLDYKIPGGKIAEWITFLTGDNPEELAVINLRRLKAFLETGEIPTIEGQSSGRDEDSGVIQ